MATVLAFIAGAICGVGIWASPGAPEQDRESLILVERAVEALIGAQLNLVVFSRSRFGPVRRPSRE